MKHQHLNHIVLSDGNVFGVFHRLGKQVPFYAYNFEKALGTGDTPEEAITNSGIPRWDIEVIE